jgi:SAM-dependent methyltransferase
MNLPMLENRPIILNATQINAIVGFHELVYEGQISIKPVEKCFCGSTDFRLLSRCDRFGLPFGTKICKTCGLITQTVQMQPDSMPLFYENIYWPLVIGKNASESAVDAYVTRPKNDEVSSYVLRSIGLLKKQVSIFEVGCGAGIRIDRLKNELIQQGFEVKAYGCDYSSDALLQAQNKGIKIIKGGFEEIGQFGKADILILSHLFEHLPDLDMALRQINNLLHNESLLYVEVPGVVDLENKEEYDFNYQTYCVLAHTYNFSLQSLSNVMSRGGFRLVEGDEYVRSIFVKGVPHEASVSAYQQITDALERAHKKQALIEKRRNHRGVRYLRNVAKALLGRLSI